MDSPVGKAYLMELVLALALTTFINKANIISDASKETSTVHVMTCPEIYILMCINQCRLWSSCSVFLTHYEVKKDFVYL